MIAADRTLTYRELDAAVSATSAELRSIPNGRLACVLDPGWRYVTLLLAAIRAGVAAIPLSSRLPPAAIQERREYVAAGALVSDRPNLRDAIRPDSLLSSKPNAVAQDEEYDLDSPATIVFTSGSSGRPKAVLHTVGNHYFSAEGSNQNIAVGPGDRWLLSLPLYHVGGLAIIFRCLLGRGAVYIPEPDLPLAEAAPKVTHMSMVATQLRRLLASDGEPHLRAILLGGSAIPDGLIAEAHHRGLPIHTSYGLTEMASQVTTTPPGAEVRILKTSGYLLPHRELRIHPNGEVFVRGRTRFAGYVEDVELAKPFDEEGWYATGDLGQIDSEGLLRIRGRKDNMFISGGENIVPEEIEAALLALPEIEDAIIVPVQDEEWGHRPVAFVRMTSAELDVEAVREKLAEIVPRFMVPVAFYTWRPQTAGLKVDRESLRQEAEKRRRR